MDKNIDVDCAADLIKELREYPGFLEIFIEDDMGLRKIKSIRWEEGGPASWLVLSASSLEAADG